MAEIEFSAGSLSVVDDWLGTDNANDTSESTADANVQSDEEEGQKRGREARLGLGAKFLPGAQSKVVYTAEQKMINKLKGKSTKNKNKEERREQELMRAQQEEEGEESRTSSVSKSDKTNAKNDKKKNKKKKKNPVKKAEPLEKRLNDEQLLEEQSASQAEADLEEAGSKIEMQSQESNEEGGSVRNETKPKQVSATENPELSGTEAENSKKHWEHNRGWSGFAPQEARYVVMKEVLHACFFCENVQVLLFASHSGTPTRVCALHHTPTHKCKFSNLHHTKNHTHEAHTQQNTT